MPDTHSGRAITNVRSRLLSVPKGAPTMRRPFTVVATSLLSFGLASCSTSDDAAKQPAPSPVILTTSPTSGEAKQPTEPLAEQSPPSDSSAPEASPEPPPAD